MGKLPLMRAKQTNVPLGNLISIPAHPQATHSWRKLQRSSALHNFSPFPLITNLVFCNKSDRFRSLVLKNYLLSADISIIKKSLLVPEQTRVTMTEFIQKGVNNITLGDKGIGNPSME